MTADTAIGCCEGHFGVIASFRNPLVLAGVVVTLTMLGVLAT
jgi:hypothetical protein